ncbi:MAG: hypothetical protein B6I22_09990 [Desulfobacteraceae bacterium 4572_123]|nr:MAG: hypothetical protein B6I22_09990 [Desulfobacteraceae bacterium 4572_123]
MLIKEMLSKASHLEIYKNRVRTDDYCEVVFHDRDSSEWNRILTDLLGRPRKHAGASPDAKDLDLTRQTGGIRIEQTLFEKKIDDFTVIAKFWPWKDGLHTTLKMALLKE